MRSDDLRGRFARGGVFLAAGTGIERALRFVRNIIFARFIAPDDMGLVAICVTILSMFEAAGEVGIRFSVIQNKSGDRYDYLNAAWWFQAARALVLTAAGVAAAGWIASFYEDPALGNLLRMAFLAVLFNGLISPGSHVLEKKLHFGKYVVMTQGSMLVGTLVTILLAVIYRSVWAVIIGFSLEGLIRLILSFVICPFRPQMHIDRHAIKELSAFAKGMWGMPILTLIAFQADVFVLGKMVSKEMVGFYFLAFQLARIPRDLAVQIVGKLLLPVFAIKQDDRESLHKGLCQSTHWVTLMIGPLTGFFAACSAATLVVLYTPEYSTAATAFILMALTTFLRVQAVITANMYFAIHQLNPQRLFTAVRVAVMLALLIPFIKARGITGAAMAVLSGELSGFILQMAMLHRNIGLSPRRYLVSMTSGLLPTAAVAAICWMIGYGLNPSYKPMLIAGLCILAAGYIITGIWQFKAFKQLLKQGLGTSIASNDAQPNDERTL
jgi:PST family polysaccharide transporter/lipopolysaccharide exporter